MFFKLVKILLITILSIILLFFGLVIGLYSVKIRDINSQRKYVSSLSSFYQSDEYVPIDDQTFMNFDLEDPSIHLNEIQLMASHNSYKKQGTALGHFFVSLGSSVEEAKALEYENIRLTEQLKAGIRSFEFDVRVRKTEFMLTHVPLVDNSATAPLLELALEEIALYSTYNPNHFPIIVLMEIKDDWMILDHALQVIDQSHLIRLDQMIKSKIGDALYTPSDMIQTPNTLSETILTNGWPSISQLLGKVLFILHPGEFTNMYVDIDPSLQELSMFPGSYASESTPSYASFYVINDPASPMIETLVNQNYIVRTRINEQLEVDNDTYLLALSSGAQILTSDFTVARKDIDESEHLYFDSKKTIRINPVTG